MDYIAIILLFLYTCTQVRGEFTDNKIPAIIPYFDSIDNYFGNKPYFPGIYIHVTISSEMTIGKEKFYI